MIERGSPYFNTKCEVGQQKFQEEMQNAPLEELFNDKSVMNSDYKKLMKLWNGAMARSFRKVRKSKGSCRGLDSEIKQLMSEERNVKKWNDSREKEEKLKDIRAEISQRIAANIETEMKNKVHSITSAKCPQAEVFKIRRNMNKTENLDFPLKDSDGNIRVTKQGIDEVISSHFCKVFNQNPIKEGWEEYWRYVVDIYEMTSQKEELSTGDGPTFEEINTIINNLDKTRQFMEQ